MSLCWLPALALICGCSQAVTVTGVVEYAGEPVEQGIVQLQPAEGRPVSDKIAGGEYVLDAEKGLKPGTYKVRLFGQKETGKWEVNPDFPGSKKEEDRVKQLVEYLPPKYNYDTQITVELSGGLNQFDFRLDK